LKETSDGKALECALTAIPGFHRASENLWNWSAPAARAARTTPEDARTFISTFGDGSVSMGHIELDANDAQAGDELAAGAPKGYRHCSTPSLVLRRRASRRVQTVAEMMASRPADEGRAPSLGLPPDEARAIIHETLERHYPAGFSTSPCRCWEM